MWGIIATWRMAVEGISEASERCAGPACGCRDTRRHRCCHGYYPPGSYRSNQIINHKSLCLFPKKHLLFSVRRTI